MCRESAVRIHTHIPTLESVPPQVVWKASPPARVCGIARRAWVLQGGEEAGRAPGG